MATEISEETNPQSRAEVRPPGGAQSEVEAEREKQNSREYRPFLSQESISQSAKACTQVRDALNKLTGRPLISILDPKAEPDLREYLFKQPDEYSIWYQDGRRYEETYHMRQGIYGQRTEINPSDRMRDTPASTEMTQRPDYFNDLSAVFGKSTYFDLVRNHNAVITNPRLRSLVDVVKQAKKEEAKVIEYVGKEVKDKSNTILINFDSHSDAFSAETQRNSASIAQWVNAVLLANPNITEYYWVLPDNFKSDSALRKTFFEHKGKIPEDDQVFAHSPSKMDLYLDKGNGALIMNGKPADFSESKYRKISFNKVTIDDLPNLKGRTVVASVDLDYFDNNGYDTTENASVPWQGEAGFAKFARTLREKEIRVAATTVSASPEYVRQEHSRDLLRFATHIADSTKTRMDEIVVPKQNRVYLNDEHIGIQVDRDTPALKLLFEMFKIDSTTKSPTDSIDLNAPGEKLEATISAAAKHLSLNKVQAMEYLRKLDSADGKSDGIIQYELIEAMLQRVCKRSPEDLLRLKKR